MPRKTVAALAPATAGAAASMRPRPDAAENVDLPFVEAILARMLQ